MSDKCKSCHGVGQPRPECFRPRPPNDNDEDSLTVKFSSFPKEALEVMSLLRCHQKLCDVEINVGNEVFQAHKIVLASASPYFKVSSHKCHFITVWF